jgi:hypothetical protein
MRGGTRSSDGSTASQGESAAGSQESTELEQCGER